MSEQDTLAHTFEQHRTSLLAAAYRMLGSWSESEDAVQESWLRLSRVDARSIENIGGWLTTVVSRICLDSLRSRKSRREDSIESVLPEAINGLEAAINPEEEILLADSIGVAMLVVLGNLKPVERVAFVLHEVFAMPFHEIALIIDKSEAATRQLTSRARRRVRGAQVNESDIARERDVVRAFLAAAREGDFDSLIAALDPDVILRDDRQSGASRVVRGARSLAKQVSERAHRSAQLALVDGTAGILVAPCGRLLYLLKFTTSHGKIVEVDLISSPERIRRINLAVLD